MVNTEIRLTIFFAAKDEALHCQQKQDQEMTVAQIMNSLPNSNLNFLAAIFKKKKETSDVNLYNIFY